MLRKINYIFNRRQKRNLVILFMIIFIGAFMELIGVAAIMPLVTIITDESVVNKEAIYIWIGRLCNLESSREFILFYIFVLIVVFILKNIYILFQYNMQYKFAYNNQRRLATKMMGCYLQQDYLYHVSKNIGELQRNVSEDVISFYNVILAIIQCLSEIMVCVMLVAYLLYTSFNFTIGIVLLLGIILCLFIKIYRKYTIKLGDAYRRSAGARNKWIIQAFEGIKEIKVMNKESYFLWQYDENYKKSAAAQRKHLMLGAIPRPVLETFCICGVLGVMAVQTFLGFDMKNFIPILSTFVVAAFRMMPSFSRISAYINTILFGKAPIDNIYQDLKEIERLLESNQNNYGDDFFHFDLNKNIEIEDLSFHYPNSEKAILTNVSFEIPPNKSVAFIGPSGAGKTTLADIILGILTPQNGLVAVDGHNIFHHIKAWHKNIGYIPQMIYLMNDTIRNNIAFGVARETIDDRAIWSALREAQLEEFVRGLPDGLDTQVGDRGMKLSGGQRQRIGIARALYTDPRLLILDEATSALDNETEAAVMEAIDSLHGSRTMIIIAHRLTTIKNCDIIYEVNNQKVVERDKKEVLRE